MVSRAPQLCMYFVYVCTCVVEAFIIQSADILYIIKLLDVTFTQDDFWPFTNKKTKVETVRQDSASNESPKSSPSDTDRIQVWLHVNTTAA